LARYGILADVHGNREALEAVLALLDREGVEVVVSLGDVVGYCADPNPCVALLRERRAEAVAGNHDLISIRRLGFERCSNKAAFALRRTRRELSADSAAYLAALPPRKLLEDAFALVHGGVDDVQEYVTTAQQVRENLRRLDAVFPRARVCFFGHTHTAAAYEIDGEAVRERRAEAVLRLAPERRYFINPGAVDPSRRSDHAQAECAVFDAGAGTVAFHRVGFDQAAAEARARARGYRVGPWRARLLAAGRRLRRALGRLRRR